ncbi:MAG: adenylate kinase [Synergistales bacterium]|nr:adenylate kinase [Synergistales bacterium]
MRLVFLGPPGAGKGTQAAVVTEHYRIAHISTGDILRSNVKSGTELGQKARQYMDAGELVPDELIVEMMRGRLTEEDCSEGFILDGFPRTVPQAEALDSLLEELGIALDAAILFDVSDQVVVERLSGRRVCKDCGAVYHVVMSPPEREGVCDRCGGTLIQRDDDREDVVRQRLDVYRRQTEPLVAYYRNRGLLREIDASGPKDTALRVLSSSV